MIHGSGEIFNKWQQRRSYGVVSTDYSFKNEIIFKFDAEDP